MEYTLFRPLEKTNDYVFFAGLHQRWNWSLWELFSCTKKTFKIYMKTDCQVIVRVSVKIKLSGWEIILNLISCSIFHQFDIFKHNISFDSEKKLEQSVYLYTDYFNSIFTIHIKNSRLHKTTQEISWIFISH